MPKQDLTPQVFTDSVKPLTDFLEKKFPNGLCVSDIRDKLGKQYVDLVQEGGGVHGIALAGYTYVLEKMNIGFMKMAGTSAGSINTLLLNAVNTKQEAERLKQAGKLKTDVVYYDTRSEKVLDYLAKKDLSELVDGHPLWRKLILNIFTPSSRSGSIKGQASSVKTAGKIGAGLFIIFLACALCLAFYTTQNGLWLFFRWAAIISAAGLIICLAYIISRLVLVRLLYKHAEKFGINPGKNFEDWLTRILMENGIESVDDLNEKFKNEKQILDPRFNPCPDRKPFAEKISQSTNLPVNTDSILEQVKNNNIKVEVLFDDLHQLLMPDLKAQKQQYEQQLEVVVHAFEQRLANEANQDPTVTREIIIVSSDITHELKVEFPGMHKMYWGNDYGISPAKYVRASMSVPLFFKPFQVNFNPGQMLTIREEWLKLLKTQKNLEECALFVDGGLLSNFPINVFYDPNRPVPRKPTFGIKLEYEDESLPTNIKDILGFTGSIINTMRYFYDRDFALKHDIFEKTVRSIDTGKVHWLNFNLRDQDKIELFFRGALTATLFLAKHIMTDHEVQELIKSGSKVTYAENTFSIYTDGEINFRTEDCLIGNVTFEWQTYKKERLLDRISKEEKKNDRKAEAALQKVPQTVSSKIMNNEPNPL
jgi:predicted acylesterase/phospholipase RssA